MKTDDSLNPEPTDLPVDPAAEPVSPGHEPLDPLPEDSQDRSIEVPDLSTDEGAEAALEQFIGEPTHET